MPEENSSHLATSESSVCGRKQSSPRRVHYFNITYACNSRCRFCAADSVVRGGSPSNKSIPLQSFIKVLEELALRSEDQVILNGGEPTIHPQFPGFLQAIVKHGTQRTVFTNGRKLSDISFTEVVASCHPVELLIPIYSSAPKEHDACTGVYGSFDQTIRGIRNIFDLQQRGYVLPIEVRLLLSRMTAPHAAGVVRFLCQSFTDGDFSFSLNPLIVSQQAMDGCHVASLFNYVDILEGVKCECSAHNRTLITKNLPRCLVWRVSPEEAMSRVFIGAQSRSQETYFDPLRLSSNGLNDHREFAALCTRCILRQSCAGFPVGHTHVFGNTDARPVTYDDIVGKANELLLSLIGSDDHIDVSGVRHILLPEESMCFVEPETGSWLTMEDSSIRDYFASRGSSSVAEIEDAFPRHGAEIATNLLLSGVGRLNGRRLAPTNNRDKSACRPSITALVIKYTRSCNLRCAYCYVHGCRAVTSPALPNGTIIDALDSLAPFLSDPFDLIIHGGEPLMRAHDLRELFSRLNTHPLADRINLNIQTNGVLITETCAEFLREHSVAIGVSVDGITLQENGYRTFSNGFPSLASTLEGIKHLLSVGLKPGLISVLHRKNQHGLLDSLKTYSSFGITNFVVNPLFPGGAAKSLGPFAMPETDAAVETFKNMLLWINDENKSRCGDSRLYERNLSTLIQHLTTYQRQYMCARIPCGAGLHTLSIDADGSVYPCDDFISAPEFCLGTVEELENLERMFARSDMIHQLHTRSVRQCSPCCCCSWQAVCPSHCAAESYFTKGDLFHGGVLCKVMQRLIPIALGLLSARRIDPQLIVKGPFPVISTSEPLRADTNAGI